MVFMTKKKKGKERKRKKKKEKTLAWKKQINKIFSSCVHSFGNHAFMFRIGPSWRPP